MKLIDRENSVGTTEGFILPTAILFLSILSLLGLGGLLLAQLEQRMSHHFTEDFQQLKITEAVLHNAEKNLVQSDNFNCYYGAPHNKPWELSTTCQEIIANIPVAYVVEKMPNPDHSCIFQAEGKPRVESRFYRISAWTTLKGEGFSVLQTTEAIPGNPPCNTRGKGVKVGRLSWIYTHF